ncbi:MAG: transcription antitermination factor NusB [Leptolyngbyaceae cyanobacterium MO_188.B28]|nr:transcription antitermination factor NusB [Leptolyngbyaceae cyanobacterium MO_188.B28]
MQARRIARELALLGMSQLPDKPEKLEGLQLNELLLSAVQTLTAEARDSLETAAAELGRGSDRLRDSETRSVNLHSAREMMKEAIELTETTINRLGAALDLPEFIQSTNQDAAQEYALQILTQMIRYRAEVDTRLDQAMVAWQLKRLAHIDRDILRIAMVEILYLELPIRIAINEAVELAKRYSGEEGYRFINGVLRRVTDQLKAERSSAGFQNEATSSSPDDPQTSPPITPSVPS